ncbi:excinuclease ABC subunit UvrB [Candidatus Babeliales bacterium]|nr:excinuclease ABC subunit UvrB [Candidatus Babeliales bacterium]
MGNLFKLKSPFKPTGHQPQAIELLGQDRPGKSLLLGVTGSGKTFTLANVIANQNKQVLVLSPNKTLAAQLYEEFSLFFPENKVCYFVSYYDYYQPESYVPSSDTYIAKETKINDQIERFRVEATASLINRPDTIVVASVSAIYSLGNPADYRSQALCIKVGDTISRKDLLEKLISIQYVRNEVERSASTMQVHGSAVTINVPYLHDSVRIDLFGDKVDSIELVNRKNFSVKGEMDNILIFPARHFVVPAGRLESVIKEIETDLHQALPKIENDLFRQRLKTRVMHDIAMMRATGYCSGIENYSRYFDGRSPGQPPFCLLNFFDKDFLFIIDESHISVPQIGAMYKGDRARKASLIDYGFRLPSSYDNRPLKFDEVEQYFRNSIFTSATPGKYEMENAETVAEQIVRPTGILDPQISIHAREGQLEHLLKQIKTVSKKGFRILITTLTKRSSEELASYLEERKIRVCYLHSDIKTPERSEILAKLRDGTFECLVGINLLREGLDLPEVALVAILDADIEGFLRNTRSLIQTIGRAARNVESKVIFYADKITPSIKSALEETERRRGIQSDYNKKHSIIPRSTQREVSKSIVTNNSGNRAGQKTSEKSKKNNSVEMIERMKKEMALAAEQLNFEKAIALRDKINELLSIG